MKQNERLLVYAVTGFLALILVIAVLFGGDPADANEKDQAGKGTSLSEILNPGSKPGDPAGKGGAAAEQGGDQAGPGSRTGLAGPEQVKTEQPLVAKVAPSVLVERQIGPYRRDRTVRFVRAHAGDSFDSLVRRWCGKRDPLLVEEVVRLNEETRMLQAGQEVAVPWVDDEVLLALIEAEQRPTLVAGGSPGRAAGVPTPSAGVPRPAVDRPTFRQPALEQGGPVSTETRAAAPAAAGEEYEIRSGDSLWKIAERLYGKDNAYRMVKKIEALNRGLDPNRLRIGKSIKVPAVGE